MSENKAELNKEDTYNKVEDNYLQKQGKTSNDNDLRVRVNVGHNNEMRMLRWAGCKTRDRIKNEDIWGEANIRPMRT